MLVFFELCSFPLFFLLYVHRSPPLLFGVRGSPVVCLKEVNRRSLELKQLHSGTVLHQNMLNQAFYQRIQLRDQRLEGANFTGEGCDTVRH